MKNGEQRAQAAAYLRYAPIVSHKVRPWLKGAGRSSWREDLVHEVFCRALSRPAGLAFDEERPLLPYLLTIARNILIDWVRSDRRSLAKTLLVAVPPPACTSNPVADGDCFALARLRSFLGSLSGPMLEVYRRRFVDEQPSRKAARAMGLTHQRARTLERNLLRSAKKNFEGEQHK